jgi:hypothetical protein
MTPWVVVPVFNEQATVGRVVAGARRWAPVLVIDDGSSDDSGRVAREAGAEVIRRPRRLGKGQALRTGLATARGRGASHVITMDGDGQHAPDDLPTLLAAAVEEPGAIIIGGRLAGDRRPAALTPGRLNAIRVAGFFVNWAVGLPLRDTQSGFRVYPLAVLEGLRTRRGGFVFETEVLVAAATGGVPVREVAVMASPRTARRSRFRPIVDGTAIGAYLAACCLARWGQEMVAAAREMAAVFHADRRRVRHDAMWEAGAACHSLPAWGAAVSIVAARRAGERLAAWWRHPRRRRATVAAGAMLTAPFLLGACLVSVLGGRRLVDVVTPLVLRLYSQDRLDAPPALRAHERRRAQATEPVASRRPG